MPKGKAFDFTRYKQRHICLWLTYFGWDYDGMADQGENTKTIEYSLFKALKKTCLVDPEGPVCYQRCGRTDKGVSSSGQIVNLIVRSNLINESDPANVGLFTPNNYAGHQSCDNEDRTELNYTNMINNVLPDEIRVISWAPVKKDFSSRFCCEQRTYTYLFPRGDLDIESMTAALSYLEGTHDFRNICKFDLKNGVVNHERTIVETDLYPVQYLGQTMTEGASSYTYYEAKIVGKAFLYHQIRCIMSIVFLVGQNKEEPSIVKKLLDINSIPSRPQYNMASPTPLCLKHCDYKSEDLPVGWINDEKALADVHRHFRTLWCSYRTKAMMIERAIDSLPQLSVSHEAKRFKKGFERWSDFGIDCDRLSDSKYVPLAKRSRDEPLEKRLEILQNKRAQRQEATSGDGP